MAPRSSYCNNSGGLYLNQTSCRIKNETAIDISGIWAVTLIGVIREGYLRIRTSKIEFGILNSREWCVYSILFKYYSFAMVYAVFTFKRFCFGTKYDRSTVVYRFD